MGDDSLIPKVRDAFADTCIIHLLCIIKLMTPRISGSMEVAHVFEIVPDGPNDVTLHDLHVINIVEQFPPWRIHPLANLYAPSGVVTHIPWVVDLAVQ